MAALRQDILVLIGAGCSRRHEQTVDCTSEANIADMVLEN